MCCVVMAFEGVLSLIEDIPGGPYAVLGAAVAGLVGVLALCYTLGCGRGSRQELKEKKRTVSESDSAGEEPPGEQSKSKQQSKGKGFKHSKQQVSKKVALPQHPLLATEFKGHTGAVISLDFDVNGKFLASCSDGKFDSIFVY